jgi:hypothetical protein
MTEPVDQNEALVVVYEAPDSFHADLATQALEEAGIPVIVQADRVGVMDNLDLSMIGRYARLLVLESKADAARAVVEDFLRDFEADKFALPDELEEPEASS